MSSTIYKGATVTHSTGAGSLNAPKAVYYRDKLTNYVIGAKSAAEAETEAETETETETEFAIRQDILV